MSTGFDSVVEGTTSEEAVDVTGAIATYRLAAIAGN